MSFIVIGDRNICCIVYFDFDKLGKFMVGGDSKVVLCGEWYVLIVKGSLGEFICGKVFVFLE